MIPASLPPSTPTSAPDTLSALASVDQITARDLVAIPAELKARAIMAQAEASGLKVMREALEFILRKMS